MSNMISYVWVKHFNSLLEAEDGNLKKLVQVDHPSSTKRGCICIYYKESSAVKMINIPCKNVYITKMEFITLKDMLSLSSDPQVKIVQTWKIFKTNFALLHGDNIAWTKSLWVLNTNTLEDMQLDALTSLDGLHHLLNETTHILPSSSFSIDVIFTNQSSSVISSRTHSSLYRNCHYHITYY